MIFRGFLFSVHYFLLILKAFYILETLILCLLYMLQIFFQLAPVVVFLLFSELICVILHIETSCVYVGRFINYSLFHELPFCFLLRLIYIFL